MPDTRRSGFKCRHIISVYEDNETGSSLRLESLEENERTEYIVVFRDYLSGEETNKKYAQFNDATTRFESMVNFMLKNRGSYTRKMCEFVLNLKLIGVAD